METQDKLIKLDRRAVRSRRLIVEAWRELILEKEYKKISVSDIVERADIGRATFYAHFEDKDHLGRFIFSQLLAQIEKEIQISLEESHSQSVYQTLVPSLALFRIAAEKHRWFKKNGTNPENGLGMLIPPLVKRLEAQLDSMDLPDTHDEVPRWVTATYLVSALIALITEWVITDMPESPEAMDAMYQTLAAPTINRLLGMRAFADE
ncbi:MAG: TetR family transcriptional regulator [Chloroflexi bacterium]|nr:TetR family transcriptional regulator [Chloroflexota bacterium]